MPTACQTTRPRTPNRLLPFGQFLFVAGILLVVARALTELSRFPGLPAFWYANLPMWILTGLAMSALGWKIVWGSPSAALNGWHPTIPGTRFRSGIIYTGEGCHLCDDAMEVLNDYSTWLPIFEKVDIHADPDLEAQFGTSIPVIVLDGKIRFRGRICEQLLQRLIEGTPPVA